MVLIIANANPYVYSDGVKKYIQVQDSSFQDKEIDSLTLFPIIRRFNLGSALHLWGCVLRVNERRYYRTLNDKHLTMFAKKYGSRIDAIFMHHLKDVNTVILQKVLSVCSGRVFFYVHDYYTCCTSINLLKNGKVFCGSSILLENKCKECLFYKKTLKTKGGVERLLTCVEKRLEVIAPSEIAASYWSDAFPQFKEKVRVVGHQVFSGEYKENKCLLQKDEPVRVAFVGAGDYLKGVDYWKNAINQLGLNKNLSFYHFGRSYWDNENVKHFDVSANSKKHDTMISALRKNKIHVAILNSFVPETYSYTYYEALSSNCYIVTNEKSGNIAYEVRKNHNGIVLSNPADLTQCLSDVKKLKNDVNEFRKNKENGPLNAYPNTDSIFPCTMKKDLNDVNECGFGKRSILEFVIDLLLKKHSISAMEN